MALYNLDFHWEVVDAYERIIDMFYEEDLKPFYEPGMELPSIGLEIGVQWMNAFKDRKLNYLKMDEQSFKYNYALWRAVNVDLEDEGDADVDCPLNPYIKLPLPVLARMNSLSTALWNALKGGGDAATKLLDIINERLSVRSENNTVSCRLLQYFGIVFHRGNQWCYAKKDLDFYPSLSHARHANNQRASIRSSIRTFGNMFLEQAHQGSE